MKQGMCKHYNGSHSNECCDAGVSYDVVTPDHKKPGCGFRKPCIAVTSNHGLQVLADLGPQGSCDRYEEPSKEEIAADVQAMDAAVNRMLSVGPVLSEVRRNHAGENWSGVIQCPVCEGALSLSHAAYNGHISGRCGTEGCVSWME